ncbi:hypothetical protein [Streptomyces noursei]|uniref:hypothetical protein n=1 Tax=Streptomyces noursei TaxID=1971 RepID=UPI00382A9215
MTVESLAVLEQDDAYTPPAEPHIAWEPCRFLDDVDSQTQYQSRGARLYLREGRRVLATAEVEGSRRSVIDVADEVSLEIGPWLPAMRLLADAVALEREADTLDYQMRQLLHHWQAAQDMPVITAANYRVYDAQTDAAYRYEDLVRAIIPREDQVGARLPEAAATHSARLRERAAYLRTQAVVAMPDPRASDLPGVAWVGPYSDQQHREIRARSRDIWYADLPHQILMGWSGLDTAARWPADECVARRDALIRWAARRGLPKKALSDASGVARTTINRVLS